MNTELKKLFQKSFSIADYTNLVMKNLLHCRRILTNPELLETDANGDQIFGLGTTYDIDGKEIGFYYTKVKTSDVTRKRVGFHKMMQPYVNYGVDAAIAVFDDGHRWRLSYISDLKGGVTSAKRFSYVAGDPYGQYNTPSHRLADLGSISSKLRISDIYEAFSVDALSKEFFDEYHFHYDRIVAELARQGKTGAIYHDYVKKLMGRIVFLHFLQKKGWLCGDTNFMLNTFSKSDRQNDYLESVLEPLFFGILNTEPSKREQVFSKNGWQQRWVGQWASIPYLNGGLFERDAVDDLIIVLPKSIFGNLFTFLASYNFTVDENDPDDAEIGVDPEMLGKIFESLLEDNKSKGAFYTPKEIVRYMCKESLIAHLSSKLPEVADSVVRKFVESHEMQPELEQFRESLSQILREIKICDPAIGSGAFPMGLLNELWRCREALGATESRVVLKKEIIENNIYGVDIERGAIDIARLRFWLSIVVDSEKAEPLPNFDYKFMQGNSLIESYQGYDLSRIAGRLRGGQSKSMQLVLGLDSDLSRKNLQRLLRDYFSVADHQKKANMRHAINEEVKTLIRESFGGTPASLAKLNALDTSANQDFFLWHTWFKDIFDKGGFDIVIGNPPYIQLQADGGKLGELYKDSGFYTFARTGDIYSLFYEHGWNILAKGGHLCYITSNKWMRAGYGEKTREFFTTKTNPKLLVDLGANVFENATVDTNILLFSKTSNQRETKSVTFTEDSLENLSDFVQQQGTTCHYNGADSWVILSAIEQSIKRKIEAVGTPLRDWDINIYRGVLTGYNEAFIIDTNKRNEILDKCQTEEERKRTAELIRPILRGRDIKRCAYDWANLWLINTHNGVRGRIPRIDINDYPAIKQHLDKYWDKICSRADKGDTPYNLRNCAYLDDFYRPKLMYADITQKLDFCYCDDVMFCNNTTYFMTANDSKLLPKIMHYLNSPLMDWYYRTISVQLGEKAVRMFSIYVLKIPIPKDLSDNIYEAYHLTNEEVTFIEHQ